MLLLLACAETPADTSDTRADTSDTSIADTSTDASVPGVPRITGDLSLASADARLIGETDDDRAGRSVSAAGDVDGDGLADLWIGAYRESTVAPQAGAAYLVRGGVTGTIDLSVADAKLLGEAMQDYAGRCVAPAGDVNGDGYADLLVGAYNNDEGGVDAGASYLLLGPVSGTRSLADADARILGAAAGDTSGVSVSSAGDMDGDGLPDLLIGAFYNDAAGEDAGAAYILFGAARAANVPSTVSLADADATLLGAEPGDQAGVSATSAGDVDGDGIDDLLVGAFFSDLGAIAGGAAYLVRGPVTADLDLSDADAVFVGVGETDFAGRSVAAAGDVDADGHADLLVGAYFEDTIGEKAGATYVVRGSASLTGARSLATADGILYGEAAGDESGISVASAGDLDADGRDDVLVGAIGHDARAGATYVVLGPATGTLLLGDANARLLGEAAGDESGVWVAGVGDTNGDGGADLLVGARYEDTGGADASGAYLLFGGVE